jgi:uncharacterized protein (TIGR00251 family)
MSSGFFVERPDGIYLSVKVHPRAKRNQIGPKVGQELKISLTAPPVDGAANEALIRFLAETLGCARSAITIVRGQSSRHKIVRVQGVAGSVVQAGLGL